jgi:bifunctional DNA-binding transcriptional regulator/antitoxin component of YhaV-PrlF toxin-antitoxin module
MNTLIINEKGQIELPEDRLRHVGLDPGDELIAEKPPDGRIELSVFKPTRKISDAFGCLKAKREGRTLSIE